MKFDGIELESSQPLLLCTEDEDEDTETRRDMACVSTLLLDLLERWRASDTLGLLARLVPSSELIKSKRSRA